MTIKHHVNNIVDLFIIFGYSAFAFAFMPVFVMSAWLFERTSDTADLAEAEA